MPLATPRDSVVRAAFEATFRARAYDRTLTETLWGRVVGWIDDKLSALFHAAGSSRAVTWTIVAVAALLTVTLVARSAYLASRRSEAARGGRARARGAAADDPWHAAMALAAAGDFTAAAHALYAALLARLAQRERLTRHPAKTAGDYARDLRALGSRAHAPFRRFARDYDRVVYGLGACDQAHFARLLEAANGILPLAADGAREATGARRG